MSRTSARSFLRFLLSEDAQSVIPERNWMYPAVTPPGGLPTSFKGLAVPETSLLMAPEAVREGRRGWIDEWLGAMSR